MEAVGISWDAILGDIYQNHSNGFISIGRSIYLLQTVIFYFFYFLIINLSFKMQMLSTLSIVFLTSVLKQLERNYSQNRSR